MDRSGVLNLWSLFRSKKILVDPDNPRNTAYWSKLSLSFKTSINLNDNLRENALVVTSFLAWSNENRTTTFVIGTVNGFAVKGDMPEDKENKNVNKKPQPHRPHVPQSQMNGIMQNGLPNEESSPNEGKNLLISDKVCLEKFCDDDSKAWITCVDYSPQFNLLVVSKI